jgi:hypothetical protein
MRKEIAFPCLSIALLACASAARAEDGTVDLALTTQRSLSTIEMGDTTYYSGGGTGTLAVTRASGPPFETDSAAGSQCVQHSRKSAGGFELESQCVSTFTGGDSVWIRFRRKSGDLAQGTSGRGVEDIIGGTGKFAGISGECDYKVDNLPNQWNIAFSKCRWHR